LVWEQECVCVCVSKGLELMVNIRVTSL